MPSRKMKDAGKENGTDEIVMADSPSMKPTAKREAKGKNTQQSKRPRKDAAAADGPKEANGKVGSGRQAAQNLDFQEKGLRGSKDELVEVKEASLCASEAAALAETDVGVGATAPRRLSDFSVVDSAGNVEPVEAVEYVQKELFLSGVVYPAKGPLSKATGRRVERFGPLRSFSLDASAKAAECVVLVTDAGAYVAMRPAPSYKKVFANLAGQAIIAHEIVQALTPATGGAPDTTLDEVVARLARAKVVKGFSTPREGLLVNGKFVLAQLEKLDAANPAAEKDGRLVDCAFAKALGEALQEFKYVGAQGAAAAGGGIVIHEPGERKASATACAAAGSESDAQMEADEDFARQLQAKMDAEMRGRRTAAPKGGKASNAYIKVSEAEIADDYPPPAAYNKEEEETDELLLFDEELMEVDPEYLPRSLLTDFSIYNSEGLFASLELLPMWSGVDPDVELYASGVVVEDDGDFSGGLALGGDAEEAAGGSGSGSGGSVAGGASSAGGAAAAAQPAGMRMFLSQIREWVVEFGADMLFVSIRTDVAWYRLSVPSEKYKPWFGVAVKCSRIAARVLGMLSEESRASKLSFTDVVKRLAKDEDSAPTYVSKRPDRVERFLSVHAQILLNCFNSYPVKAVRNSAFAAALKDKLAAVRHSKLYRTGIKAKSLRGINRNPMRDRAAGARSKPMTATATVMVKSVWQAYFAVAEKAAAGEEGEEAAAAAAAAAAGGVAKEVEEDLNEEENDEEEAETALAEKPALVTSPKAASKSKKAAAAAAAASKPKAAWVGSPAANEGARKFYSAFTLDGVKVALGDAVVLSPVDAAKKGSKKASSEEEEEEEEEDAEEAPLGLVQALWQEGSGAKRVQVRLLARGADTVLGDAASDCELFLTTDAATWPLDGVAGKLKASRLQRIWDASLRAAHFAEDEALRQRNETAVAEGGDVEFFWRREYVPQEGMFRDPPRDLRLGARVVETADADASDCEDSDSEMEVEESANESKNAVKGVRALADGAGFVKDGVTYRVGDFMFVGPEVFDQMPEAKRDVQLPEYLANSRYHKGSHVGLRAWGVGRLVKLGAAGSKKGGKGSASEATRNRLTTVTLQRFWRPEDISADASYKAGSYSDVYASAEEVSVAVADVVAPLTVRSAGCSTSIDAFTCVGSFDRKSKAFGPPPKDLPAAPVQAGKSSAVLGHAVGGDDGIALATMDIFAGCGGLSEGMHQAGAAVAKWAIEYEVPAAESFKLNNPDAAVFANNCNVLLHASMAKAGLESDCLACPDAVEASAALPQADREALPLPGEVEFICGGPPCQGYSGMNRFNKGNWSMVQNSMVMAFLSYADFYRPRYFLLENVRNFVSHNKSFTFRLTVRSLLDMGYQVRFGVLNAGNFGVAQSRKRTFIWAAAPGELLPDWPRLMHAFRTPQLAINLPGGVQYTAVPQTVGAPLRPVTVRDAIGDLPAIANGHDVDEMPYSDAPASAFQRAVRGDCDLLTDHISKQMNELNLERCRCIPKNRPGADWRVLEEIVRGDPSRELFKGQPLVPWCLPNTADRHNGWRGLFGRLDWAGHFPTSTTDPQPMGKVGQVFHPEQDRIVSVRECARAQGFPDRHRFYGTVHNKHRQVGNAVPPPLAAALGRQLRKALEQHAAMEAEEARAALAAQM